MLGKFFKGVERLIKRLSKCRKRLHFIASRDPRDHVFNCPVVRPENDDAWTRLKLPDFIEIGSAGSVTIEKCCGT